MRKKRRVLLTAALVIVLGAFAWTVLMVQDREPGYEGRNLSSWLLQYKDSPLTGRPGAQEEHAQAANAVRHIGTNAIPSLLRMLRARDSATSRKLIKLLQKQPLMRSRFTLAEERNYEGQFGFEILGADGKSAVPDLIEIFERTDSEYARNYAAMALGGIGPEAKRAIPSLIKNVTDTTRPASFSAVLALGEIHSQPEVVVPVLLKLMYSTNRSVWIPAMRAIGDFGPAASQAISPLLAEATNTTSRLRYEAIRTLGRIHAEPELVVPMLVSCLRETESRARYAATEGLGSFGADAKPALPALLALAHDPDSLLRLSAMEALVKIDTQNPAVLQALCAELEDAKPGLRRQAATFIVSMGASAKPAIPYLIKALKDDDSNVSDLAGTALKQIDPEVAAKAGVK